MSIKRKAAVLLRPYPSVYGWTRRITSALRLTAPSEDDYLFDFAQRRRADVFFLQIGANDGSLDDPIYHLVRRYAWRGVLMEPLRDVFVRLMANYEGVKGLTFVNAALAKADGRAPFYRVKSASGMPSWSAGVAGLLREPIAAQSNYVPGLDQHILAQQVETICFSSLVQRYHIERIDLLLVDTEGYDLQILRHFDFKRFQPDLVIYERKHLSEVDASAAEELLERSSYRIEPCSPANGVAALV